MQYAAQTYDAVAKQIAKPRELEADLLLAAAARLQAIYDGWDAKWSELDAPDWPPFEVLSALHGEIFAGQEGDAACGTNFIATPFMQ
jgi:hypothetical protein